MTILNQYLFTFHDVLRDFRVFGQRAGWDHLSFRDVGHFIFFCALSSWSQNILLHRITGTDFTISSLAQCGQVVLQVKLGFCAVSRDTVLSNWGLNFTVPTLSNFLHCFYNGFNILNVRLLVVNDVTSASVNFMLLLHCKGTISEACRLTLTTGDDVAPVFSADTLPPAELLFSTWHNRTV